MKDCKSPNMGLPWSCNSAVITALLLLSGYNTQMQVAANTDNNDIVQSGCEAKLEDCRRQYTQLAYDGLPPIVHSPEQLKEHCSTKLYGQCLKEIEVNSCDKLESLNIEGQIKAEEYVCSENGIKLYEKGNKYTDHPWENLGKWYMKDENKMCQEKFLESTEDFFNSYDMLTKQIDALEESAESKNKEKLQVKADKEMNHYCNYMYVYQECIESAATRHCNKTIGDWQYDVVKTYFIPHFQHMGCHIGKGMRPLTIAAIVIVSIILSLIFALACFCGVYEKCCESCHCNKKKRKGDYTDHLMGVTETAANMLI